MTKCNKGNQVKILNRPATVDNRLEYRIISQKTCKITYTDSYELSRNKAGEPFFNSFH